MTTIVALLSAAVIGRAIRSAKQREIDSHLPSERAAIFQALMGSLGVVSPRGPMAAGTARAWLQPIVRDGNQWVLEPEWDAPVMRSLPQPNLQQCMASRAG